MNEMEPSYIDDFEKIRQAIEQARQEASYKVNGKKANRNSNRFSLSVNGILLP